MNRRAAAVAELQRRIGVTIADPQLLERALTHPSVGEGAVRVAHYEQLEFLGDRVLNLLAAERLMEMYPQAKEGELSRMVAASVDYQSCARVAREIGLPDALRLSASATKVGARQSDAVLGDACEALIAVIYIDGGLAAARTFFLNFWGEALNALDSPRTKDPKTALQEWAQGRGLPLPVYSVIGRSGPDHAPVFTIAVQVEGFAPETGTGRTKQDAQKAAAQTMLSKRQDTP